MKKKKSPLPILCTVLIAAIMGSLLDQNGRLLGYSLLPFFELGGDLFIRGLSLLVIPLVSSSIIFGMSKFGKDDSLRSLGLKTLSFYLGTSLIAVLIGIFFVNLIQPGLAVPSISITPETAGEIHNLNMENHTGISIRLFLETLIPHNLFHAFLENQMLGVIFFSLLFGYALSIIPREKSATIISFFEGLSQTMIQVAQFVLRFLPFGVFCLVARSFAKTGVDSLLSLALFSLSVLLGLVVFMFGLLPLLIRIVTGKNPFLLIKAMGPALVTAFSTSSSSASLPITLECVEKRAGVSSRIAGLVVPLGTSINMSGSALYECMAAIFVAQAYGIEASISTQFSVVLLALVASIGVAGIPSGSLIATIIVIQSIGLPVESIGLFLAVDRLMDMARTTVNVFSDSSCAVLVASLQGERVLETIPEDKKQGEMKC